MASEKPQNGLTSVAVCARLIPVAAGCPWGLIVADGPGEVRTMKQVEISSSIDKVIKNFEAEMGPDNLAKLGAALDDWILSGSSGIAGEPVGIYSLFDSGEQVEPMFKVE